MCFALWNFIMKQKEQILRCLFGLYSAKHKCCSFYWYFVYTVKRAILCSVLVFQLYCRNPKLCPMYVVCYSAKHEVYALSQISKAKSPHFGPYFLQLKCQGWASTPATLALYGVTKKSKAQNLLFALSVIKQNTRRYVLCTLG